MGSFTSLKHVTPKNEKHTYLTHEIIVVVYAHEHPPRKPVTLELDQS